MISMACEASELELNMAEPIIAFNLLFGLTLLRNAAIILNMRCLAYVQNSIGLVTALNPVLGYEKSAAIAKEALVTNRSVYELVLEKICSPKFSWMTSSNLRT
jgi:aspartate ammonia-lyase